MLLGVPYTLYIDQEALEDALERDDVENVEDIAGWTNHYYRECRVGSNVNAFQLVRTIWHEILHAMMYVKGDTKRTHNEAYDSFSLALTSFIWFNTEFMLDLCKFIMEAKEKGEDLWNISKVPEGSEK